MLEDRGEGRGEVRGAGGVVVVEYSLAYHSKCRFFETLSSYGVSLRQTRSIEHSFNSDKLAVDCASSNHDREIRELYFERTPKRQRKLFRIHEQVDIVLIT